MSQTSSVHFIMQMRLSGAAQISPPFEIGCGCLLFLFRSSFLSLWVVSKKGFVVLGWQLESRGIREAGEWEDPFLLISSLSYSFFAEDRKGETNPRCLILSLSKLLGRVWPGEVSLGLGMGASRIGRVTQKPLSFGVVAAAGPDLRLRHSFPRSQV